MESLQLGDSFFFIDADDRMVRMRKYSGLPAWLMPAGIDEINLSEPVRRQLGILLASDEQLFLYRIENVLLAALNGPQAAARIKAQLQPGDVLCINGRAPADVLSWSSWAECHEDWNYAFLRQELPPAVLPEGAVLRKLDMADLPYVLNHYETVQEERYLSDRIAAGMLGIEAGGSLRGFIGSHPEGTMGILFVEPAWRCRHFGAALVSGMIRDLRTREIIPIAQVDIHNEASRRLYESLSMQRSSQPVRWYF